MAKKKKKRKAKKRAKTSLPKPAREPSPDDFNVYITFVVYAVTGIMAQADVVMQRHAGAVRRVARWLMEKQPVTVGTLYRGVLIEPGRVKKGRLTHEQERRFVSWTEDRDVACWFAAPDSIVSELVIQMRPDSRPYLIEKKVPKDKVLWHHEWTQIPVPGIGPISLTGAAAIHPEIDHGQFDWNVGTQKEVITEAPAPTGQRFKLEPVGEDTCPETDELDARFAYPPYVEFWSGTHGG
jgi:hypothetical protein